MMHDRSVALAQADHPVPRAHRGGALKMCLVGPPTVTDFEDPEVAESEAIRLIAEHAPIGVLSLAAVLERHGVAPQIVDLNRLYYAYLRAPGEAAAKPDFCSYVAAELDKLDFDVLGFSSICSSYPLTIRIAQDMKRRRPDVPIIFGGPQASVVDVPTMQAYPFVDFVVRGEAEETLPALIKTIAAGASPAGIQGLTYRDGDRLVRAPNAPIIADLDAIPLPAFHLYPELKDCHYVPLELGRGCPFACTFCSTNDFFRRKFRLKSPEKVIEQMRQVRDVYGITTFDLIHDMFTVDRKRVIAFCEAVIATGETFYWNCSARTDCIDDDMIATMARAGCKAIFFGIETGSARLQKIVKKNIDLNEATARLVATDGNQITTAVSLITGFPDETMEDLRDTVHFFVDSLRFDFAEPQLHILAPLAETPLESRFRSQLVFDDILSDMSHQGWRQDPVDREMIQQHLDIFPNFYSIPTPALDRAYLRELRDFLLNGSARFRWLLVALHQDSGDVTKAFEAFRNWYAATPDKGPRPGLQESRYYASITFRDDFFEFVRDVYAPRLARTPRVLHSIMDYERALIAETPLPADTAIDGHDVSDITLVPKLVDGVVLTECAADYQRIIRCLRRKGDLRRIPRKPATIATRQHADKRLDVVLLSPLSAQLLKLCDGERAISEIATRLVPASRSMANIPTDKVCMFGLEVLRQQGLIALHRESAISASQA
ncbi:B12-binding domain-containing radical SAM protein [Bradyrhizobium manausense]|uniref:B12-binding domain-containing radical SAM protein n=1 Tax=Bradyrhizobium TaxID=374 RepID=UPI001BA9320B|nr:MULTISPECIES: radical SAM protein [Bradyrhizobium]MBR0824379.1 B12-binding domain-containing radical SAM protein [Bradyrhizobium manausense]UVO26774.1 B12-binding domain-containing radical SAM protein [Bradyrhizobium arachidis]